MSKEDFQAILDRQQQSGLTIKDFCENEAYSLSCFHYWKSKYGLNRPYGSVSASSSTEFAPVSFRMAPSPSSQRLSADSPIGGLRCFLFTVIGIRIIEKQRAWIISL